MKKFTVFTIVLLFSSSLYSQDSLKNYLDIAVKKNPAVLQKFAEYEAALQKVPQVGSLPDPELSAGLFLKPMELVNGNQVSDIRLMQMFPWFGVLKNAKDEMSLMARAKFEVFRDAQWQLFYDVQKTWYELFKIRQEIRISKKNIGILQSIESLTLAKFKSGSYANPWVSVSQPGMQSPPSLSVSKGNSGMSSMGSVRENNPAPVSGQSAGSMQPGSMSSSAGSKLTDIYTIQIETGDLENSISLLQNQEQSLTALFNGYLNRQADYPVSTSEFISPDSLGFSPVSLSDTIQEKNAMLNMLKFEKLSIEARKKMVAHMGYPMIGVGLNYSLMNKNGMSGSSMNGKDMIMPMVTVTLPVYRNKYRAMVREADYLQAAAFQNCLATANALKTDYYEALQLYKDASRRMKLYENQSMLASKSLDLVLKSFSASTSGLAEVLQSRRQMLDYELKKITAQADFNTAVAWLKRLGNVEGK
jgi:outer membrane protein TolC